MTQNPQIEALKEARQFILAPAEDLLWGVVHRIDAALREAAAPSEEPVGYLFELCYNHEHDWWSGPLYSGRLPKAEDVRNVRPLVFASPAVAPVAVSVKPKPLEWHGPDVMDEFTARSILGVFVIGAKQRNGKRWCMGDYHDTLEAAKAAAQSDFNARILSSIIINKGLPDEK